MLTTTSSFSPYGKTGKGGTPPSDWPTGQNLHIPERASRVLERHPDESLRVAAQHATHGAWRHHLPTL